MNNDKKWLNEYESFLDSENASVPRTLKNQVFSKMKPLLHPSAWMVFFKVLGIHSVVGLLSLSVCHQFGMNPFGTERSLDDWFMTMLGHNACMVACGTLFVSASILTASVVLKIEELRALKQTQFLQTLSLGAFSLGLFLFFGAEIALTIAGLWLLGAVVGGIVTTELTWKVRRLA